MRCLEKKNVLFKVIAFCCKKAVKVRFFFAKFMKDFVSRFYAWCEVADLSRELDWCIKMARFLKLNI